LTIKSVLALLPLPRGSAHEIAFAAQMHENRGRVPRFSYFQREKVSAWELSDVRVLQSQNTDCRKNEVFRQSQHCTLCTVLFSSAGEILRTDVRFYSENIRQIAEK
jgi:hypothetical protein